MFDLFSDPVKVAQQWEIICSEYGFAVWETLYALALEVIFAYVIGLPAGVLLVTGEKEGIHPLPGWLMKLVNVVINLLRSVPFLILMIIVLPLSKILVGTKVGTIATIPVIEAAQSMGASTWQIVTKVLLPEATPSLISGATITIGTILGYGAMSAALGGGGLGKMAINYGYYNFKFIVMWAAVIGLIVLVQIFQSAGTKIAASCDKRLKNRS